MNKAQAREAILHHLREYCDSFLEGGHNAGANRQYNCPFCGSGEGPNHSGALTISNNNPVQFHCFSCGKSGNIFTLIKAVEHLDNYANQFRRACELFHITDDTGEVAAADFKDEYLSPEDRPAGKSAQASTQKNPEADYTDFYKMAADHLENTDYHRGISLETLRRFNVGYVSKWKHPKTASNSKVPYSSRLIIPTSKESYIARQTDKTGNPKYWKQKVGPVHIFNSSTLQKPGSPVYITEGEIDAMTLEDNGARAVAIGSTAMINRFIEYLRGHPPAVPLIILMDNDEPGQTAAMALDEQLFTIGVEHYSVKPEDFYNVAELETDFKDCNEFLEAGAAEPLRAAIARTTKKVNDIHDRHYEAEKLLYMEASAAGRLQNFIDGINGSVNTPPTETGYHRLDQLLEGGLYEGLYIIGAVSSLGKTTFTMQMADQIAASGRDVLILSLEMSANELISKSISRITLTRGLRTGADSRLYKTSRGITVGSRWKKYDTAQKNYIFDCMAEYGETCANHIFIKEGVGNIGVTEARKAVADHHKYTGNYPVLIVDYLQALAGQDPRETDKARVDGNVLELKRISRDYKIPVFCISSFNRQNYTEAVNMAAFKESGMIEYSSDVLIGLQLKGAGSKNFDMEDEKDKDPREIELLILKNRQGEAGKRAFVEFKYFPKFNYFEEV